MIKLVRLSALLLFSTSLFAEDELIKYGDFEQWITRHYKESAVIGGNRKTILEIGPTSTWPEGEPYVNKGGSPWATSNVYAKVSGVVKTNASVYRDSHEGHGSCIKLVTHEEAVKVIGLINIRVLAAGSLFTGEMKEPIKSSRNPMSNMSIGIPFTHRPRAIKFDYKVELSDAPDRIRQTGFSRVSKVSGRDLCEAVIILQQRKEDAKGNLSARRVGTMIVRFDRSTGVWVNDHEFPIRYGDISREADYHDWMGPISGERTYYAYNSKGKLVPCPEEGWAAADAVPTHAIVKFDSSHGGAYTGSVGNTLWVDNVRWVY
jgi:hypothetical protein